VPICFIAVATVTVIFAIVSSASKNRIASLLAFAFGFGLNLCYATKSKICGWYGKCSFCSEMSLSLPFQPGSGSCQGATWHCPCTWRRLCSL